MAATIPDADEVFALFFDRWYDDDDRNRKDFEHTRPDMMSGYRTGLAATEISPLAKESQAEVLRRIDVMLRSVRADWTSYLPVSGEIDDSWVQVFDDYYDAERIATVIHRSDPGDFSNDFLVLVCQFGAVLGNVLLQTQPRLQWIPEWPYWESSLYDPVSGNIVPPFHWAIKKFSSYGVDDGFAAKLHWCAEVLNQPLDDEAGST